MHSTWGVLAGYLLGSIPFAYLAGRARGIDLRQHGSGNLGATNVARVIGARAGALVYVADTAKGFVAAFALPRLLGVDPVGIWAVLYGVAAVMGHARPAFLRFRRGGKGIATAGGVFLGLAPVPLLLAAFAWLLVFVATGYVSLASLAAAGALPLAVAAWRGWEVTNPVFVAALAVAAFAWLAHRANIARLWRGEEHRFHPGLLRRGDVAPRPQERKPESQRGESQ